MVTATDIPGTAWSALETESPPSGTCPPHPTPPASVPREYRVSGALCRAGV